MTLECLVAVATSSHDRMTPFPTVALAGRRAPGVSDGTAVQRDATNTANDARRIYSMFLLR
jgi:hypothetical protein